MWLFAHEGLTKEAEELAKEQGILWSNREQLDGVLQYLDLRPLPNLDKSLVSGKSAGKVQVKLSNG